MTVVLLFAVSNKRGRETVATLDERGFELAKALIRGLRYPDRLL